MKTRRVAFVGLCIVMLIAAGAYGDKTEVQGKPGKPPWTSKECIVFTEDLEGRKDLEGGQIVERVLSECRSIP